jgi:hypothetical protein
MTSTWTTRASTIAYERNYGGARRLPSSKNDRIFTPIDVSAVYAHPVRKLGLGKSGCDAKPSHISPHHSLHVLYNVAQTNSVL